MLILILHHSGHFEYDHAPRAKPTQMVIGIGVEPPAYPGCG